MTSVISRFHAKLQVSAAVHRLHKINTCKAAQGCVLAAGAKRSGLVQQRVQNSCLLRGKTFQDVPSSHRQLCAGPIDSAVAVVPFEVQGAGFFCP